MSHISRNYFSSHLLLRSIIILYSVPLKVRSNSPLTPVNSVTSPSPLLTHCNSELQNFRIFWSQKNAWIHLFTLVHFTSKPRLYLAVIFLCSKATKSASAVTFCMNFDEIWSVKCLNENFQGISIHGFNPMIAQNSSHLISVARSRFSCSCSPIDVFVCRFSSETSANSAAKSLSSVVRWMLFRV